MYNKKYKNFNVSSEIYPFVRNMDTVEAYREELQALSQKWDNLTLLAQLRNSKTNVDGTKSEFTELIEHLLNHLAIETLNRSVNEMTTKAQIAVDIVIRNLFERTADIGFLATDTEIRNFVKNNISPYAPNFKENVVALKERFKEYISKYSVYFDIVLITKNGDILATLNESNAKLSSKDSIIQIALNTQDDYIESYKYHDFAPHLQESLVYAYKITETEEKASQSIGVLCLCFKFKDEMDGIFAHLASKNNKECIMILDNAGKVIASSDTNHIDIGRTVEMNLHKPYQLISFGGRDYIAKTCKTNGYQGFYGLGWYGHIMIPIEHAFNNENEKLTGISNEIILAILQNGEDFSNELKSIPLQACNIQETLNRTLWNGSISSEAGNINDRNFSRVLLQETGKIGALTKDAFNDSIINLTQTIILNNTTAISSLMIDIMDRNLYERANDCRWWALTPDFRNILSKKLIIGSEINLLSSILKYINNLYTVYTNLFLYDSNGVILAISNDEQKHIIGKKINKKWIENTLTIHNTHQYCVSDFEATDLYDNKYTYIYSAPIHAPDNSSVVGGIGIVFNSQNEFQQMLQDALPRQLSGEIKQGAFGFFTTKDKMIIASSHDTSMIGQVLNLDDRFFTLSNGDSINEIIVYNNNYYAVGITCSNGYREYKSSSDSYQNDVLAFFFSFISKTDLTLPRTINTFCSHAIDNTSHNEKSTIATFYIGDRWLGMYAESILEAVSIKAVQNSIAVNTDSFLKGTLFLNDKLVSVIDLKSFIAQTNEPYSDVVIIKYGQGSDEKYIGILANSLGDMTEVLKSRIKPIDRLFISNGAIMDGVVLPEQSDLNKQALTILNIEKIGKELTLNIAQGN